MLRSRLISAGVMGLFIAAVVVFDTIFPPALNIVVAIISGLCVYEISNALGVSKKVVLLIPSLLFAVVVPFLPLGIAQQIAYCVYTLLIFSSLIFYHDTVTFREAGILYSMAMIIPTALMMLVQVRDNGGHHGMFYVIIAIFCAWAADVGGFTAGCLFGKHKLCPNISPKKTVEGLVGGFALDLIGILLIGFVYDLVRENTTVNYLVLAGMSLVSAGLSVIGDLSFSLIKRSCNIKDFGELIPGHGGFLDRFDSVIFVAPFVAIVTSFLPLAV